MQACRALVKNRTFRPGRESDLFPLTHVFVFPSALLKIFAGIESTLFSKFAIEVWLIIKHELMRGFGSINLRIGIHRLKQGG